MYSLPVGIKKIEGCTCKCLITVAILCHVLRVFSYFEQTKSILLDTKPNVVENEAYMTCYGVY